MSRKTKKKDKRNNKPISNLWFGALFIVLLFVCKYTVDWFYMNVPMSSVSSIHPAEINWNNGLPLLLGYSFGLIVLSVVGFYMGKKIDRISYGRCTSLETV